MKISIPERDTRVERPCFPDAVEYPDPYLLGLEWSTDSALSYTDTAVLFSSPLPGRGPGGRPFLFGNGEGEPMKLRWVAAAAALLLAGHGSAGDAPKLTDQKNKKEGEAFLAGNRKKEGVVTLPSGLQYKVIKPGDGASPKETDTVETNYR